MKGSWVRSTGHRSLSNKSHASAQEQSQASGQNEWTQMTGFPAYVQKYIGQDKINIGQGSKNIGHIGHDLIRPSLMYYYVIQPNTK
jgi:hypothetical protein